MLAGLRRTHLPSVLRNAFRWRAVEARRRDVERTAKYSSESVPQLPRSVDARRARTSRVADAGGRTLLQLDRVNSSIPRNRQKRLTGVACKSSSTCLIAEVREAAEFTCWALCDMFSVTGAGFLDKEPTRIGAQ